MADLFTEGSTASTDEEATALLAGLDDDMSTLISGLGEEDDIMDLAALLGGVGGDPTGSDTGDSQSEVAGDVAEEAEEESTEEATDETEDSEEAPDAATEDNEADAAKDKPKTVPAETRDMRVLRDSHKFRTTVEPLIKDFHDELPQIAGIATAIRGTDGNATLQAIEGYSEAAAGSIRSSVLEANAESYVAAKYGVTPETLATVFTKQPAISDTLKGELEYLTDESRAEVEALLKQPTVVAEKDKILEARVAALSGELKAERESSVEAAVEMHFKQLVEKAKLEGKFAELEQTALLKIRANETAQGAIDAAFAAAREGRKNDTLRHLKTFNRELADIVKDMAKAAPAKQAVAEVESPAPKAPKAPVVKPQATKTVQKAAPVAQSKEAAVGLQGKDLDRHMLEFARAESKKFGVGWRG